MSFTRFDRHENMRTETGEEILNIIMTGGLPDSIKNSLYGLFDGYLYSDLLSEVKEVASPSVVERVKRVVEEVKLYPIQPNI